MNIQTIFDILGWIAALVSLTGYYLVSNKIVEGFSWSFQTTVFVTNVLFLAVNIHRATWSFVLMNAVYLVINFNTFYKLYQSTNTTNSLKTVGE